MRLLGDNILVSELQDDLLYNGTVVRYDQDNPYMFCKILCLSDTASDIFSLEDVIIIKRYAKEEYLPGTYFISLKDVRGTLSYGEYLKLIA